MKKVILLLSASIALFSCNKDSYTISGTAKGIENGKTIILESQDDKLGVIAVDTVKVENGTFKMEGKTTEPSFHLITIEGIQGKLPFILENGSIEIVVNKDTLQNSKISGTYNNDEFASFNKEITQVQKKLIDFQTANTQKMNDAQAKKDTAVINGLMKEFMTIQQEVSTASKNKYVTYAETHPKSFISALIVQGMLNDPSSDVKKTEKLYDGLEDALKNTKPGKAIKARLTEMKAPTVGAKPAVTAPTETK
ncbi:MAG: DUF4369 domain-containing protein [Flavobacterium sp.]